MQGIVTQYLIGTPLSRLALVLVAIVGFLVAVPLSDALGWNRWATRLTLWGLGGALIPTFVYRLGSNDVGLDVRAANDCLSAISPTWLDPDSVANLLLLVPFGVGLALASRSALLAGGGVVALGLAIEIGQQVTGLGACERGDLVRNIGGGLVAVGLTALIRRARSRPRPVPGAVPHRP